MSDPGDVPQINPLNFGDFGYDFLAVRAGRRCTPTARSGATSTTTSARRSSTKYNGDFPATTRRSRTRAPTARGAAEVPRQPALDPARLRREAADADRAVDARGAGRDARGRPEPVDGDDETELWPSEPERALARVRKRHGFGGEKAFSTKTFSNHNDRDPIPDFASPRQNEAKVTFKAVSSDEGGNIPVTRTSGSTSAGTRHASRRSPTPTRPRRRPLRRQAPPRTSTTRPRSCPARTSSRPTPPATATSASG